MDDIRPEPSPRRRSQRLQAAAVLALGLLVGAAALFLVWQERAQEPKAPTTLSEAGGVFPVVSVFSIDESGSQPDAGHVAPDFNIHLPDGTTTRLSAYRGQPVLINFWASWCGPCKSEMPDLVAAHQKYQDQGLVVLEINDAESHAKVTEFVEAFGMRMPVFVDPMGEVMASYKTNALPSSFFIDRDGIVQVRWVGLLTPELLEQNLRTIL